MTTANWGWPMTRRSTVASSTAPKSADDADREGERGPVADAVPDHEHVADEGAQHEQVALGEVDQLGGLVDEDEAEGDQAVDAAHGEAVQGELQDRVQRGPPPASPALRPPRRPCRGVTVMGAVISGGRRSSQLAVAVGPGAGRIQTAVSWKTAPPLG